VDLVRRHPAHAVPAGLDITGGGTANSTKLQLWDCNGGAGQQWVANADGTIRNPASAAAWTPPPERRPTDPAADLRLQRLGGTGLSGRHSPATGVETRG